MLSWKLLAFSSKLLDMVDWNLLVECLGLEEAGYPEGEHFMKISCCQEPGMFMSTVIRKKKNNLLLYILAPGNPGTENPVRNSTSNFSRKTLQKTESKAKIFLQVTMPRFSLFSIDT